MAEKADIELLFDKESKSVFDQLIWRILHGALKESQANLVKFYDTGPFVYKFADILKDTGSLTWINFAPWDTVRKVWMKILDLSNKVGNYEAYTEIFKLLLNKEDLKIWFESRTTQQIWNEKFDFITFYEWELLVNNGPADQKTTLWTNTKDILNYLKVYSYDEARQIMVEEYISQDPSRSNFIIVKNYDEEDTDYPENRILRSNFSNKYIVQEQDLEGIQMESSIEGISSKFLGANSTPIITYRLTGNTKQVSAAFTVLMNPGILNIYLEDPDSLYNLFLFKTSDNINEIIQYYGSATNYPLYLTQVKNISYNVIQQILDFITPIGLITHLNLGRPVNLIESDEL